MGNGEPTGSHGEQGSIVNSSIRMQCLDIVNHKNSVLQAKVQRAIKTGQQTRALVMVKINMHCQSITSIISQGSTKQ